MRGSGDHQRIGSPSLNHGKMPDAYASSNVAVLSVRPTASNPFGSRKARSTAGNGSRGPSQGTIVYYDCTGERSGGTLSLTEARRMMTRRYVLMTMIAVAGLAVAARVAAQDDKPQVKVGVLPFVDATGSGGVEAGPALSRLVQAEIVHSTQLFGRVLTLDNGKPEDVDVEKAAQLGKDAHVDIVLLGTVLEASSEESSKSGWTPTIGGQ